MWATLNIDCFTQEKKSHLRSKIFLIKKGKIILILAKVVFDP